MKVVLKDDKIYRIEKRENHNNNNLCPKGLSSIQDIYHPDRLLYPMKRTSFEACEVGTHQLGRSSVHHR